MLAELLSGEGVEDRHADEANFDSSSTWSAGSSRPSRLIGHRGDTAVATPVQPGRRDAAPVEN